MADSLILRPSEIEKESFRIISEALTEHQVAAENINVVKRVIHTTADFDYADSLVFSTNVVSDSIATLLSGASIVTDTKMGLSGINRAALAQTGSTAHCFIDEPDVLTAATKAGTTRAQAAVDYAVSVLPAPIIFFVGNAPTALLRLHQLVTSGACFPALVVGVPVGFVNVIESKELILELDVPYIVARGRKGGSNVAAAIANALIYQAVGRSL
ncbi:MAG: precorrin-8X methylmutase [Coriobacteriia bacterium]|nr:precorrin-8X methylmutase [Coriobacteriia bacterium]